MDRSSKKIAFSIHQARDLPSLGCKKFDQQKIPHFSAGAAPTENTPEPNFRSQGGRRQNSGFHEQEAAKENRFEIFGHFEP